MENSLHKNILGSHKSTKKQNNRASFLLFRFIKYQTEIVQNNGANNILGSHKDTTKQKQKKATQLFIDVSEY